MVENDNNTLI